MERIIRKEHTEWVVPPPPTEKVCSKCEKNFPISEFPKNNIKSDGHSAYCKSCAREAVQISRAVSRLKRGKPLSPGTEPYRAQAEERIRQQKTPGDPKHGTAERYRNGPDETGIVDRGCRCPKCKLAQKAHVKNLAKLRKERHAEIDAATGRATKS